MTTKEICELIILRAKADPKWLDAENMCHGFRIGGSFCDDEWDFTDVTLMGTCGYTKGGDSVNVEIIPVRSKFSSRESFLPFAIISASSDAPSKEEFMAMNAIAGLLVFYGTQLIQEEFGA